MAQRADALGDRIDRVPELRVLGHEHRMQRVEHRPGDVPVEIVGLEIERVGVGQKVAQTVGNLLAVRFLDADRDGG